MELVTKPDWILTKNGILQKVKELLEQLQSEQYELLKLAAPSLPPEVINIPPKISRGENYKGLPYLVLDHPRFFDKENIFAIRTMFWWGHHFSTTLHLSGRYKKEFRQKIVSSIELLKTNHFFICVHQTEWEHHFEADNYASLQGMSEAALSQAIQHGAFLKLAQKIPLEQWPDGKSKLYACFSHLVTILAG